jgi:surface antigen
MLIALAIALLAGLVLAPMARAGTDDYPAQWRNVAQDSAIDSWGYYNRECTSFVAWRLHARNGFEMPRAIGNAGSWGSWFSAHGYAVNGTPGVGAIAESSGHVAWVEAVNGDGTVTTEEYNYSYNGTYNERRVATSAFHYIHARDIAEVGTRLTGDVNGDHKADAVVMYRDSGSAFVGLSTGTSFGKPRPMKLRSLGRREQVLPGRCQRRRSSRPGVVLRHRWQLVRIAVIRQRFLVTDTVAAGQAVGTSKQFLADVNGDSMADLVTFDSNTGDWYVSTSSGSGFWPPTRWIQGHGYGSSQQRVGDFNSDGKADAAVYFESSGNWYVGLSTGSAFGYPGQWSAGHGMNSANQVAADISGDHRADIAYYYTIGTWEAGTSSGSGFWQPTYWAYGQGGGSTDQFMADVNGDGMADEATFFSSGGDWYVDTSSGSGFWGPPQLWVHGLVAGS